MKPLTECRAVGDGKHLGMDDIQDATDRLSAQGGGTSHFGPEKSLTGTLPRFDTICATTMITCV